MRAEIREALATQALVVPVLVDEAIMPTAEQLPQDISTLAYLNAARLRPDPDFDPDSAQIVRAIAERRPAPEAVPQNESAQLAVEFGRSVARGTLRQVKAHPVKLARARSAVGGGHPPRRGSPTRAVETVGQMALPCARRCHHLDTARQLPGALEQRSAARRGDFHRGCATPAHQTLNLRLRLRRLPQSVQHRCSATHRRGRGGVWGSCSPARAQRQPRLGSLPGWHPQPSADASSHRAGVQSIVILAIRERAALSTRLRS